MLPTRHGHTVTFASLFDRPSLRIRGRVAEHVEEDGLGEGVELGEGGAALGPQRVRLVQDLRNPPLLGEGWERDYAVLSASEA